MAVTETIETRRIVTTATGTMMFRYFAMTWTDYATPALFPYRIGDSLADDVLNFPTTEWTTSLRISAIDAGPDVNQSSICRVVLTYQTEMKSAAAYERPEDLRSVEIEVDCNPEVHTDPDEQFFQAGKYTADALIAYSSSTTFSSADFTSWRKLCVANAGSGTGFSVTSTSSAVPVVPIYFPAMNLTIRLYRSDFRFEPLNKMTLPCVNNDENFLHGLLSMIRNAKGIRYLDSS